MHQTNPTKLAAAAAFLLLGLSPCRGQKLEFVKDINTKVIDPYPRDFLAIGKQTYFVAQDARYGVELWVTDGKRSGSHLVRDVRLGPEESQPEIIGEFQGKLLFAANDGIHGRELWVSDGSKTGTKLVRDIRKGPASFFAWHVNWILGIPAQRVGSSSTSSDSMTAMAASSGSTTASKSVSSRTSTRARHRAKRST